jgi:lysophospholipase L1-like esterase
MVILVGGLALGLLATAGPAGAVKERPLGPPRVTLVGDSITASYQDEAAQALRAQGYAVTGMGVPGTGLLDADHCRRQQAKRIAKTLPDVVVLQYAGNMFRPACRTPRPLVGSKKFVRRWRKEAKEITRVLTNKGAEVIWVETPLATMVPYSSTIPTLNEVFETIGPTVDAAWPADPAMHDPDGLHLSQEGQERLATEVVEVVDDTLPAS